MALMNIRQISLINSAGTSFDMFAPDEAVINEAYFIPNVDTWDGLASISVADDVFDTDNTDFRSQLGKIQYAPRTLTIRGVIVVLNPNPDPTEKPTEEDLYEARSDCLRDLQMLFTENDGGLRLEFKHAMNLETKFTLFCHLHGADALKVIKHPNHYEVSISLIAEDPLIYQEAVTETYTSAGIYNYGDVAEFAKIELSNCNNTGWYTCIDVGRGKEQTVWFREPVTGTVIIDVKYPHQICSVGGNTTIDNIDVSGGRSAFIKLPRGKSLWNAERQATIKITYRQPLIGIAP